ncbi:unnamed protein product [Gadus morhua 'NCC']
MRITSPDERRQAIIYETMVPCVPLQNIMPQITARAELELLLDNSLQMRGQTWFRAIFLQALEVHHTFVPHVITACAILHNICLGADDIMAPEEEDEPEDDVEEDEGGDGLEASSGAPWRDQLSAEVSALEEAPPDHQYIQASV